MVLHGRRGLDGEFERKTVSLPLGPAGTGAERLAEAGIELRDEDGRQFVEFIMFGSAAERVGIDFDYEIVSIIQAAEVPPKELMFIPAFVVLGVVVLLQRRRLHTADDRASVQGWPHRRTAGGRPLPASVEHRRVPSCLDQLRVDLLCEVGREVVDGRPALRGPVEPHFHQLPVVELVGQLVDDRVDAVLPDPDGDVEVVCLLSKLLRTHGVHPP